MTAVSTLLENSVFKDALAEIEALGFHVSDRPIPGSIPYGIIGGRSNQRWWLVPLNDRRLTISGLALFQPIVTSAKVLKGAAVTASTLGLSSAWARKKVYISGCSSLEDIFADKGLSYAFFTGTDSPHRKVAVQIMDREGRIKGFAKVSKNAAVKTLLSHETKTLNYLNTLDLQTALIPKVLFCGEIGGVEVLVTDTLKTAQTKTATILTEAHAAFLQELAEKTAVPETDGTDWVVAELRDQYAMVAEKLPTVWRVRLERALDCLEKYEGQWGARCLIHGDFTPWNTFFVGGRLYVFDWEYASQNYPNAYDLLHFLHSSKNLRNKTELPLESMLNNFNHLYGLQTMTNTHLLAYMVSQFLFYLSREVTCNSTTIDEDYGLKASLIIEKLINSKLALS